MKITDARWTEASNGLPLLKLKINGVEVIIDPAQKAISEGVVFLTTPPEHLDLLPEITIPGDKSDNRGSITTNQATRDRRILRLTKEFLEAAQKDDFEPGPVALEEE
jgi:hypothetical protein